MEPRFKSVDSLFNEQNKCNMLSLISAIALLSLSARAVDFDELDYPLSIFIYPVFPLPDTTYKPSTQFPISFAVDNAAAALAWGFTFDWDMSPTPWRGENDPPYHFPHVSQDFDGENPINPTLTESGAHVFLDSIDMSQIKERPETFNVEWRFYWERCFHDEEGIQKAWLMQVSGDYNFTVSNRPGEGEAAPPTDGVRGGTKFGPGTFIAEVLGNIVDTSLPEYDIGDCPLVPDVPQQFTSRRPIPTRTIPGDTHPGPTSPAAETTRTIEATGTTGTTGTTETTGAVETPGTTGPPDFPGMGALSGPVSLTWASIAALLTVLGTMM